MVFSSQTECVGSEIFWVANGRRFLRVATLLNPIRRYDENMLIRGERTGGRCPSVLIFLHLCEWALLPKAFNDSRSPRTLFMGVSRQTGRRHGTILKFKKGTLFRNNVRFLLVSGVPRKRHDPLLLIPLSQTLMSYGSRGV